MALSSCPSIGCENKITSPSSCSVCDCFKCVECMMDSAMSICVDCNGRDVLRYTPDFFDWEGGDLRDWFYHGFISQFVDQCMEGHVFEFYCPFAETKHGFTITMPYGSRSWGELQPHLDKAKKNPGYAEILLKQGFVQFNFTHRKAAVRLHAIALELGERTKPYGIEDEFENLKWRILSEDPWWEGGLKFEIIRFQEEGGPLPWKDDGRVIVTLSMEKKSI